MHWKTIVRDKRQNGVVWRHEFYFAHNAANNSELMEKLEEVMATWSRQIEQVLVESEQIRREADNIGPLAELNYWKSRMAKFNTSVF